MIPILAVLALLYGLFRLIRWEVRRGREEFGRRPQDVAFRENRARRWGNFGRKMFGG